MILLDTFSFLAIALFWIIGALCACWCFSFYFFRKRKEIESRRPQTSVLVGILCALSCLITHSAFLLFQNIRIIPEYPYTQLVLNFIAIITDTGAIYILCFRSYMVYYDIRWNQALQDAQWRLQINPHEKNWFLRYKHVFGSGKRVATFLFIHWLLFAIGIVLSCFVNNGKTSAVTRFLTGLNGFLPMVYNFILLFLFPKYDDTWSISNEIRATLRITLMSFFLFVAVVIVMDIQPYSYQHLIFMTIETFVFMSFAWIVCYYPLQKFKLPTNPYIAGAIANNRLFQMKSSASAISAPSTPNSDLTMQQIIESKQGFNEFARHCSREFRIESFLFFVETHQWLNTLAQKDDYKMFVANNDRLIGINLPRSAPRSSILVIGTKASSSVQIVPQLQEDIQMNVDVPDSTCFPSHDEYVQCAMIFVKYVPDSSDFCINIDGPTRGALMRRFGCADGVKNAEYCAEALKENGMTKEEMFHVFDQCRFEIYRLLMSAFTRFKPVHPVTPVSQAIVPQDNSTTSNKE